MMSELDFVDVVRGEEPRSVGQAIKRGVFNNCPACGSSRLFYKFLKPVDACEACGAEMHHHRSDDLPPYIVVLILGHVLMTGYMLTDRIMPDSLWVHLAVWLPLVVITALISIQPVKGGVIGLQWALRMHGFGEGPDGAEPDA